MKKIYDNIAQTVGNTPLVRLNRITADCQAQVVAKLESFNPLGCVKERIAVSMVEADGYLRVLVYWFIGALVDKVSLYSCAVDGNLSCTDFAADFTEAEIHTDLDLITRAGERGGIESYNGRLFMSYTAATEAYLAWCRLGATTCSAAADFTRVKIAD